jgi:hypothetical protein
MLSNTLVHSSGVKSALLAMTVSNERSVTRYFCCLITSKFAPEDVRRKTEGQRDIRVIAQKWPHHGRIARPRGELELREQQPGGVPSASYRQHTAGGGGYCAMRR